MNVPSARASRASVARQYRSAAFALIFDPACVIALFILHSSKLTHPEKQSYPLTRSKARASDSCLLTLQVFSFTVKSTFYHARRQWKGVELMTTQQINRLSAKVIIFLSVLALLT